MIVGAATPASKEAKWLDEPADFVRLLASDDRIFLPGSGAEVERLVEALFAADAPRLAITGSFVPGINAVRFDRLSEGSTYTSSFAHPSRNRLQEQGRFRHVPTSYFGFACYLQQQTFDWSVVHVSPPDARGWCSLGIAVEFAPIVLRRCRRIFAVINRRMPRIPGAASVDLKRVDAVTEIDAPLREYNVGASSAEASRIAELIAPFVEDGSTLQVGLGKTPNALMQMLVDRRRLRLHSGMLSDGTRLLVEAGALDADWRSTSCVHVGTAAHYEWLSERSDFDVKSCDVTHAPATLATLRRLVAVNSALSVDLLGQANLEMLDGGMISGVGGAPDFAHAASLSQEGISIVALPSTSGRNAVSRIIPRLDGVCSLPRAAIDIVITEHGVADLRAADAMERAERIISVAAPNKRADLQGAWKQIAARL